MIKTNINSKKVLHIKKNIDASVFLLYFWVYINKVRTKIIIALRSNSDLRHRMSGDRDWPGHRPFHHNIRQTLFDFDKPTLKF